MRVLPSGNAEADAEEFNNCLNEETVSEIVAASEDGNTLIYTDSEQEQVGFVDITGNFKFAPQPLGTIDAGGSPTSVAVAGPYALVAVNTSPSFVAPDGMLQIICIADQTTVSTILLGGQPDSVAVSPDRRYAAIVIENERDEDFEDTDGAPPQLPSGPEKLEGLARLADGDWIMVTDNDGVDGSSGETQFQHLGNILLP